jgi:hypothetical protein
MAKKNEDSLVVANRFLETLDSETQKQIAAKKAELEAIQTHRNDLRAELQPLRIGRTLTEIRQLICGVDGNIVEQADSQTVAGRAWGAYKRSHLQTAGYSKSSAESYVNMIAAARDLLPSDDLITALLNYKNDKGVVQMVGGSMAKPFGKFNLYIASNDVQQYVKDGRVELPDDITAEDFVGNVFDPENAEPTERADHSVAAANFVVKRIFAELQDDGTATFSEGQTRLDEDKVVRAGYEYLKTIAAWLLNCLGVSKKAAFEPAPESEMENGLISLGQLVREVNEKKAKQIAVAQAKADAKKANKEEKIAAAKAARAASNPKESPAAPETEFVSEDGRLRVWLNPKPKFPNMPYEVTELGKKKVLAHFGTMDWAKKELANIAASPSKNNPKHQPHDANKARGPFPTEPGNAS